MQRGGFVAVAVCFAMAVGLYLADTEQLNHRSIGIVNQEFRGMPEMLVDLVAASGSHRDPDLRRILLQ
ncbi:hypothetical protein D3C74_384120 [compost metagenome]